jgi:hypothetical protein
VTLRSTVRLAALVAVGVVAFAGCTSAGGPGFVTLGVTVEGAGGGSPSAGLATVCARLPVLLGSAVDKQAAVPAGFSVKIQATRDGADVTFPGADDAPQNLSFTLDELQAGVSDNVSVRSGGGTFDVLVATGCRNP